MKNKASRNLSVGTPYIDINHSTAIYLKASLVLKMFCPCKPVPCLTNKWLKSPWMGIVWTSKISSPRWSDMLKTNDSKIKDSIPKVEGTK
jgi:hypothetical protein